jgi:hypothetical protein
MQASWQAWANRIHIYELFSDVTLVMGRKSVVKTNLTKGSIHHADALNEEANNSGGDK